jgi:hypothetical protein
MGKQIEDGRVTLVDAYLRDYAIARMREYLGDTNLEDDKIQSEYLKKLGDDKNFLDMNE